MEDLHPVFEVDALESSRPIITPVETPAEINQMFDTISYSKVNYGILSYFIKNYFFYFMYKSINAYHGELKWFISLTDSCLLIDISWVFVVVFFFYRKVQVCISSSLLNLFKTKMETYILYFCVVHIILMKYFESKINIDNSR